MEILSNTKNGQQQNNLVKYEGVPITIEGEEWIIPALNIAQARQLRPQIEMLTSISIDSGLTDVQLDALITIIHAALIRNYPDLTKDVLETMLTLANIKRVISAIMGAGGFFANHN